MIFDTLENEADFGQYKGKSWGEILMINPSYLTWVVENVRGGFLYITDNALEEIRLMFPKYEMNQRFYQNVNAQRDAFEEEMAKFDNELEGENDCWYNEPETYERYGGSYAQEVMGYSDDDIDTIFEGDPDAYWNID